jgi:hypothetical protein
LRPTPHRVGHFFARDLDEVSGKADAGKGLPAYNSRAGAADWRSLP